MPEGLTTVREVTIGGGVVLLLGLGLILRGLLVPREMYLRLVTTIEKKDEQLDKLAASFEKLSDSLDRLSRRNTRNRE